MAQERIVEPRVAEQRTYEKLKRDLDVLPNGRAEHTRKQKEMDEVKGRMGDREMKVDRQNG